MNNPGYLRKRAEITVSLQAIYDKLSRVEPNTSRVLVRRAAKRVGNLIDRVKGRRKP